jgi:hypothetical protein
MGLTDRVLIIIILSGFTVAVAAEESVCAPREQNHGVIKIKELYQKYKSSAELADVFLKSAGSGFALGIQGYPAHMRMPPEDLTKDSAGVDGFNAGYHHGLAVYCSMNKNVRRSIQGEHQPKPE